MLSEPTRQARLEPLANPVGKTFLDFSVYFHHSLVGLQSMEIDFSPKHFLNNISKARTFAFLKDVPLMKTQGLALGGSLDNAVVLDEEKVLNPGGLRYHNELVRHKILDGFGDLYLLGKSLWGGFKSYCGGHHLHYKLLKKALSQNALAVVTYENHGSGWFNEVYPSVQRAEAR